MRLSIKHSFYFTICSIATSIHQSDISDKVTIETGLKEKKKVEQPQNKTYGWIFNKPGPLG